MTSEEESPMARAMAGYLAMAERYPPSVSMSAADAARAEAWAVVPGETQEMRAARYSMAACIAETFYEVNKGVGKPWKDINLGFRQSRIALVAYALSEATP